ncbi:MAG: hypothetical protein BGO62_12055 [Thiobacillus sp. 65-1402]|nr:MAG: hypothetical protein BGO62_12055 [Thiobacillus sp. 65-1402]
MSAFREDCFAAGLDEFLSCADGQAWISLDRVLHTANLFRKMIRIEGLCFLLQIIEARATGKEAACDFSGTFRQLFGFFSGFASSILRVVD